MLGIVTAAHNIQDASYADALTIHTAHLDREDLVVIGLLGLISHKLEEEPPNEPATCPTR
jgi:hypothetical protein